MINDEGIRSLLVKLVQSGMTPEQVANYVREIVIKYVLLTDNYLSHEKDKNQNYKDTHRYTSKNVFAAVFIA